jgi:hypothetical protein|tara:strand:+ start:100 stop:672 length:573 start_codon:yes stop_codon:yes gene_type:complete
MCGGGGDNRVEELESKQALAQQAANALQRYGDVFVPLENMYIQDNLNRFGEDAYNATAGQATQGASAIYEGGLQQLNQGAFNRGLDPTSGSYQTESSALKEAQARGMGLAGAGAGLDNTDQAYRGIGNVVRMGQGLATEAQAGNISLMQSGLDRAGAQAEADFAKSSSIQQVVGTAAGMGAGYGLKQSTV